MNWHHELSARKLKRLYKRLLPGLRRAAKSKGYALGVHGSMQRDLDLIAVPWIVGAAKPFDLVDALSMVACGIHAAKIKRGSRCASQVWGRKPYGRRAITIPIGHKAIIDISFVPWLRGK